MKKVLMLLLLISPVLALAQSNADSIRFEMIRETVNFLAKDPKISTNTHFSVPCSRINYSCLEVSFNDKSLKGVLPKVRIWDSKKKGNTKTDLTELKARILKDITEPDAKKGYRKKLQGYKDYNSKLQQLANACKDRSAAVAPVNRTDKALLPQQNVKQQDPVAMDTAPADATATPQNIVDTNQTLTDKPMEVSTLTYIALAASIIAIIISFMPLSLLRKKPSIPQKNVQPLVTTPPVNNFKPEIEKLENKIGNLEANIINNIQIMKRLGDRITDLESKRPEEDSIIMQNSIKSPSGQPVQQFSPQPMSAATAWYAKFSDLDAGGFSSAILSETQNGEQTYEIFIAGNTAEYAVTNDSKAQRYALQNYEYLTNATEIKGTPQPNSRIITIGKGLLVKAADGSWLIEKKAVIEFK